MSGVLKEIVARHASSVVKASTAEAWETTAALRKQLWYTHLNALPARWQAAREEAMSIGDKVRAQEVTLGEAARFGLRALEVYAFYCVGKMAGARSLQP